MPRRSQSGSVTTREHKGHPPWPDYYTQSQQDLPDEMTRQDRASSGQAYSESGGPEVAGDRAESFEQKTMAKAERASVLAATAVNRARSMATGLESLARRRPFSALASAMLVGVVLGLFGRRRRSQ
jgi:ElaB/YqjD/DUF883 family membrane-anchored ribosome-binding protein